MSVVTNPMTDGRIAPPHEWRGRPRLSDEQYLVNLRVRFWAKVDKTPGQGPKGECWEWQGSRDGRGYGKIGFRFPNGANMPTQAHRISIYLQTGELPEEGCHHCDNPPCVRPEHLRADTHLGNMNDARERGRLPGWVRHGNGRTKLGPLRVRIQLDSAQSRILRDARSAQGLSIYDAADLLDMDFSQYSRIERGLGGLAYERLQELLSALDIPSESFGVLKQRERSDAKQSRVG